MSLFIILTILSFIYILLYYFGIIRYLTIPYSNTDKLITSYKNLDKASSTNKVIISFATNEHKLHKLKPFINSILDQSVKVDQVFMNLLNAEYKIPEYLKKIVNVNFTKDYKKATNFICTMLLEDDADTIIILLNDDYVYGIDFIETIVEEYNKNKNSAIVCKDNAILLKAQFLNVDKFENRNSEVLNEQWVLETINANKIQLNYNENYKLFS